MNRVLIIVGIFVAMAAPVYGKSKGRVCEDLNKCVGVASELTGKRYFFNQKLKGKALLSKNFELTKENADVMVSLILSENGYTRIPIEGQNAFRIIQARDVRYNASPRYEATKNSPPQVPKTADYFMMTYTFENGDYGITTEVTRSFRPFMSRYGRIIDVKGAKKVIVQDKGTNLHRLYTLIKELDREPSSSEKRARRKRKEHRQKLELLKAENCHGESKKS